MEGDASDLEEAWKAFTMMEVTGWKFLPYAGGLLEQPEILMDNIFKIARVYENKKEAK